MLRRDGYRALISLSLVFGIGCSPGEVTSETPVDDGGSSPPEPPTKPYDAGELDVERGVGRQALPHRCQWSF